MSVAPHNNAESHAKHNSHHNSNDFTNTIANGVEDNESSGSENDGDEAIDENPQIAIACDDGCIHIYSVFDSSELLYNKSLSRVNGQILSVTWSPDVCFIYFGTSEGHIICWAAKSTYEIYNINVGYEGLMSGSELCIWSFIALRNGTLVSGSVKLWDSHQGTLLLAQFAHKGDAHALDAISSQGSSLLSVDLYGSEVTGTGVGLLKNCFILEALSFNLCDKISNDGLQHNQCFSNLKTLSLRRNNEITGEGMSASSKLVNLAKLDMERCLEIHGGLVHLKGSTKLESLNIKCCTCISHLDMIHVSGLGSLKELQISSSDVTDVGISYLKGLRKWVVLNLEGCHVTTGCLETISALGALLYPNFSKCCLIDDGSEKFKGVKNLKVLNLEFHNITDSFLLHLKGLTKVETLNLDSCSIGDEWMAHLTAESVTTASNKIQAIPQSKPPGNSMKIFKANFQIFHP